MRAYKELSPAEQGKALDKCVNILLTSIIDGLRFNDALNGGNLQARIDAAINKANRMQTPWLAGEYIMDTCREDIKGMAQCDAEDALYHP